MTLPETVVQHIEAATACESKSEQDEPKSLLASFGAMLRRLIEMAASSTETKDVEACDDASSESYGYPVAPAYGVPHNVAVQLLQRAFALLSKVMEVDEIDDVLDAEVAALLKDIAAALGMQAQADQETKKRLGTWQLIQKALETQLPTEPLVTPQQAADELENAFTEFASLATKSSRTGERVYLAVLNLRSAIRKAVRVLRTLAQDQVVQVVETQDNQQPTEQPVEQPVNESAMAEQVVSEESTSQSQADQTLAAASNENSTVQSDQPVYVERLDAIERQIEELRRLVEQLMQVPVVRQRATMFASAENKPKTPEDAARVIRERYFSTRNELERKMLMREAERLIAESFLGL